MASRRGLLTDWGGVLTTDLFASFASFCEAEGLEAAKVRDLFRSDEAARDLLIEFECGRVDEREFERRFAAMLGVDEEGLVERLFAGSAPDARMLGAVKAARDAGIRTGLISNSWGVDRYPRQLMDELFDGVVISGVVGIRKPAPEIYAMGAQAVGLAPDECVFVDDLGFNLKPAKELGMATVLHTDAEQTIVQLEDLLGVALS
ncbi:MAG: HAD family phosphatase [Actinobacteria bacterium]|nr:MAG: HAD family phosphatase [Actinomycetota bacterium]